jgi:ATP-dependent DNA helicase RecG
MQESETLELKKSLAELSAGLVSISAILNKHGQGELWFGIQNNGKAIGLEVTGKTLRDVSQAIAAHVEPRLYPRVTMEKIDAAACIKVAFEGHEVPYYAHGRAYMRVADEDRQLSARELEKLILAKNSDRLRWDNGICRLGIADLDAGKLKRFIERASLTWDNPANALEKLGLLKDGKLLSAAPLFFASAAPLQLRCAVFATTDSAMIIDRHDFDGDILELIDEAQKYVLKNIHIGMRLEGLYRVDVPEIAAEALREAIINAFCHRDYRDPDYVQVAIFKDRVEIRNPGGLFGSLTFDDLRKGNVSQRRNPLIAELFRRIEMVEAWGRGLPLILKNAPDTTFREIGNLFIVEFKRPSAAVRTEDSTGAGKNIPEKKLRKDGSGKKVPEIKLKKTSVGPNVPKRKFLKESSGKTAAKILRLMTANPEITTEQLGQQLGITDRAVRQQIAKLREARLLLRTGGRKLGRWEVLQ